MGKQAKADAQELIDGYRAEKQEEFNNKVLAAGGSGGSASAKLQGETNNEIQIMQAQFQRNAQKAIDVLLSKCCEVSLDVPSARIRATQKSAMLSQYSLMDLRIGLNEMFNLKGFMFYDLL